LLALRAPIRGYNVYTFSGTTKGLR
jgi:hypothetical protein